MKEGLELKAELERLEAKGYLISSKHNSLPLTIYNYSVKTQYENYWNELTLACRGLVVDPNGQIIARPFAKFFNLGEVKDRIPNEPFRVYEKLDGSLGIFFWYEGYPVFASRGSFNSEQAMRGWKILKSKYPVNEFKQFHTYMFEIIYPENRIVVNYGNTEDVIMLGVVHTKSGEEIERHIVEKDYNEHFNIVKDYNISDSWEHLRSSNDPNREGYVVRFANGFRMKIKFDEYVRLHRILTQISNVNIWAMLRENLPLEMILEEVPDEFYNWVRSVESEIKENYGNKMAEVFTKWYEIYKILGPNASRIEYVDYISAEGREMSSLLFALYEMNMNKLKSYIWARIKPEWERPLFQV